MSSRGGEERRADTTGQPRVPQYMNISFGQTTATTPNKDTVIVRLAEKEREYLKRVFSRLYNKKCVDLDLRRHVEPRVLKWHHSHFATGDCSAQAIRAHIQEDRPNDGGSGFRVRVLSTAQVQRLIGEWYRGKCGSERLGDCQDLAQHHLGDLNSGMEVEENKK